METDPRSKKFFSVAKAVAKTSEHDGFKLGAVVVIKRKIVSVGVNSNRSHPLQKKYNIHRFSDDKCKNEIHAELDALVKAKKISNDISGGQIYVYRVKRTGEKGMSRPCHACMKAIKDFGIKKIFYTTDDGFVQEILD